MFPASRNRSLLGACAAVSACLAVVCRADETEGRNATLTVDNARVRPYATIDGKPCDPECVQLRRAGAQLTVQLEAPATATYRFGLSVESDRVAPLAPGLPACTATELPAPIVRRYPYDWTQRDPRNLLKVRPRLVMPGVQAGGKLFVVDGFELWSLRLEPTAAGRVRALLLKHRFYNDGGDAATAALPLRAGDRRTLTVNLFDDLAAANRALFGTVPPMRGRMTQCAHRGWTRKALSVAEYRRTARRLRGAFEYVIIREAALHDWIPPLFHEQGVKVFAYQYLGALRRNSPQVDEETERTMGLRGADGSLYTAPASPDGAWLLCDLRRSDVRARFVAQARAAVEAGFDGVFLDGYPYWPDATGRRGGAAPGAECSLHHARRRLLREIRRALREANPQARLGVLGNDYYDVLGEADFVLKERMYFTWDAFARRFDERRTRIRRDLDVAFETGQAPFVAGNLAYGVKGYSPLAVRSCLRFLRRPTGLVYLGVGDFLPDQLDDWLAAVVSLADDNAVCLTSLDPPSCWVHFEGKSVFWSDAPCTVAFSRPVDVVVAGGDRRERRRRLSLKPAVRYEVREEAAMRGAATGVVDAGVRPNAESTAPWVPDGEGGDGLRCPH